MKKVALTGIVLIVLSLVIFNVLKKEHTKMRTAAAWMFVGSVMLTAAGLIGWIWET